MNCNVSAGPAIAFPGVRATGPTMWELRIPMRASVLVAVAAPIFLSASTRWPGGRMISFVLIMMLAPWGQHSRPGNPFETDTLLVPIVGGLKQRARCPQMCLDRLHIQIDTQP